MFTLPDLPYAIDALEPYIDAATMRIHHDKHHGAYVKNLNDAIASINQLNTTTIEELLKKLDQVPESIRTKVRNNGGGHYNHALFWTIMCPPAESKKTTEQWSNFAIGRVITQTFGSLEKFQEQFSAAGLGRFGSGWVWLSLEDGRLKIEDSGGQDNPLMNAKTPILGLDVWEHAYYLKYQNVRAEYIQNWWSLVNWAEVERRYAAGVQ